MTKKRTALGDIIINPNIITPLCSFMEKNANSSKLRETFPNFSQEFIKEVSNQDILKSAMKSLCSIDASIICENDPLLLIVPIAGNKDSGDYISGGNYGLEVGTPGYLPWPGIYKV